MKRSADRRRALIQQEVQRLRLQLLPSLCRSVVFLGFDFCKCWMRKSKPKENTAPTGVAAAELLVRSAMFVCCNRCVSCRDTGL